MIKGISVYSIFACDEQFGIGKAGKLPWHIPEDLKHFKKVTSTAPEGKKNMVIMGRKTWESIPDQYKPLSGRINVVLSRNGIGHGEGVYVLSSLKDIEQLVSDFPTLHEIFIIGGSELYQTCENSFEIDGYFMTQISGSFDCDCFFKPDLEKYYKQELSMSTWEQHMVTFSFWGRERESVSR